METATLLAMSMAAITSTAQPKGRVEVYDFDVFKLHVYYTNDVMGDADYIIEGNESLVILEPPLFRDNIKEFNDYVEKLGKSVERIVVSYHVGETLDDKVVMPEGMLKFINGPVYGGMMKGFAKAFGDAIVEMPEGNAQEVAFGETRAYAGVQFSFRRGATSDFPAASLLIGDAVYYTHWTPAKAHISHLQLSSSAAVDAEMAEAEEELHSGAQLFIGGHGGAAHVDAVEFKLAYLRTIKRLLAENKSAASFAAALKAAYPTLPGADGIGALAEALYK